MSSCFFSRPNSYGLILVFTVLIAIPSIAAQRLIEGSRPKETEVLGFTDAYCSSLGHNARICRVETSEDGDAKFIVQIGRKIVNSSPSPYWTEAGVTPNDFVAYRGDLDADGMPEMILVSNEGMSNGIGISYATVSIFSTKNLKSAPVMIPIEEFGGRETFIFDKKLGRTLVLATYWDNYSKLDPKRGWGLYLVGKWFEYQRGKIRPVLNKPTLARRYLFRFQNQRFADSWEQRAPHGWLQDRTTHKFYREPGEPATLVSTESGVIRSFSHGAEGDCLVTIELLDGTRLEATCSEGVPADPGHVKYFPVHHLGLWQKRYVFPDKFDPTYAIGALINRKIKVETYYSDEFHYNYGLIWFTGGK